MGKGDRKTRRGKIYRGTYGNARSHKNNRPQWPTLANPALGQVADKGR